MGNTLKLGETLDNRGFNQLVSNNGLYRLTMQADGNVVLYGPSAGDRTGPNATALWEMNTDGTGAAKLFLTDGSNYSDFINVMGVSAGDSNAKHSLMDDNAGTYPNVELVIQDDGNLVLINADAEPPDNVLWSRDNWEAPLDPGGVTLVQPDGLTEGVRAFFRYAEGAIQDSVDLFGTPENTTLPPDTDAQLADWGLLDTENLSISTDALNQKTAELIGKAKEWEDADNRVITTTELVQAETDSTLGKIHTGINELNAEFQSAAMQPAVATDATVDRSDPTNQYLSPAQMDVVLSKVHGLLDDVERRVADAADANREALEKVDPPGDPGGDPPGDPGGDPPTDPGSDPPAEPGGDPTLAPGSDTIAGDDSNSSTLGQDPDGLLDTSEPIDISSPIDTSLVSDVSGPTSFLDYGMSWAQPTRPDTTGGNGLPFLQEWMGRFQSPFWPMAGSERPGFRPDFDAAGGDTTVPGQHMRHSRPIMDWGSWLSDRESVGSWANTGHLGNAISSAPPEVDPAVAPWAPVESAEPVESVGSTEPVVVSTALASGSPDLDRSSTVHTISGLRDSFPHTSTTQTWAMPARTSIVQSERADAPQ